MKRVKGSRILVSILLVAVMLLSCAVVSVSADATKTVHSHDIAIVFDNSGSMYEDSRWSRAIYAMEVFAAMLDYDHDKLGIYPMGDIQIGSGGRNIKERMDISSQSDVKDIEKIYSRITAPTILRPAYSAVEYLKRSDLEEKWLIVLTDGAFFYDKGEPNEKKEEKSPKWLQERLIEFAKDSDINVQYLGFAEASPLSGDESRNVYASNASSAETLTSELVKICNKIFKRNVVSNVSSDGSFNIDVSMNSIIAFAQGKGARINSLTGADGKAVRTVMDTKLDKPQERGTADTDYPAPIADVTGQVMTFDACPAGNYQLDFTGSNVQIFYEPNVKVTTELKDKEGNVVDMSGDIEPGDYTLSYTLTDAVTGEDVTSSPLLSPVELTATVENKGNTTQVPSGGTVTLDEDEKTRITVSGSFLNVYSISNEGENHISVKPPEIPDSALKVKVEVQNRNSGKKWYKLNDHESWKPIRVEVRYLDKPVPAEMWEDSLDVLFKPEKKELSYVVKPLPEESAFEIYIAQDESGSYIEPKTGGYRIEATATMKDEFGRELTAKGSDRFTVSGMDGFWTWLLWLLIAVGVILLVIVVLNLPAWPAKMTCHITKPKKAAGNYAIKISPNMTLVQFMFPLSCTAKKKSKLKHKFSKRAQIYVSNITADKHVESYTIGTKTYTKANGFRDGKGQQFSGIITNGKTIHMTFTAKPPLDCKIEIN